MEITYAPAVPEIVLACLAMALLMAGVFGMERSRTVSWLSVVSLAVTLLLVLAGGADRVVGLGGLFVTGAFAVYVKALVLLGSALAIVMSLTFNEREALDRFEFPIVVLFATLGMLMMVSANDLIALYLGLELQSLSLYVLAAFRRDTLRSSEAGLKYFVLGALSSGMLLYGCSMIYGFVGATGFDAIAAAVGNGDEPSLGLVVGLVFLLAGLCFKVSAAPFHMWTPDVYEGAPTPVTALFSVAPKIAALALFVRVLMEPFGDLADKWQQIIVMVAILSMLVGAFTAIAQENIKRLMAYSSIGHIGYALVGVATGTEEGVRAVLIYLAIYLFMNVGVFACILAMRQKGNAVENISDLAGFSKSRPLMAGIFAALMFSMAGIPPLAGFFGKFYVFMAAINAGLVALAVFGVLASVVGCYYYLRIVKVMYFDEAGEDMDRPLPSEIGIVAGLSATVIIFFVVVPWTITDFAGVAASTLFAG